MKVAYSASGRRDEQDGANSAQVQCQVFATTYNPEGIRMGNKILRQRLKGPALAAYYPKKVATLRDLRKEFGEDLVVWDEDEDNRLEHIEEYGSVVAQNPRWLLIILQGHISWEGFSKGEAFFLRYAVVDPVLLCDQC